MRTGKSDLKANLIVLNPNEEFKNALSTKDWLTGYALAGSYLELFGILKLKQYIEKNLVSLKEENEVQAQARKKAFENIDHLSANNIIFTLFSLNLIKSDEYITLDDFNKKRNNIIHPARKGIGYKYIEKENNLEDCLRKTIVILGNIQKIIFE